MSIPKLSLNRSRDRLAK